MTSVLFCTGCVSSRKSVTQREETQAERRDSTVRETRLVTTVPVPKSEVTLTLSADSLRELPAGASYHAKSGRANLDVKKGAEPGTIVVYASCDSLQQLVYYYEQLASKYKESLDRQAEEVKEEKKPPNVLWMRLVAFIAGWLSGTVVTLIIKKRNEKER